MIRKETLHVLRDRRMLLVVLAIPVVQMLLFGFAISTEVNRVDVVVAWLTYTDADRQAVERLAANPYINLVGSVPMSQVHDALRRGDAQAAVVFGQHPADVQILVDASNPNIAQSAQIYLQSILSSPSFGANPPSGSVAGMPSTRMLYNPQLKSGYNFVPGIMGMLFLLVCALMTAVAIVREKETGTMELLLVSPARPWQIIVSKMVPFFALSCVDLALVLLIARYALEVPMTAGISPIVLVTLLYVALSLGFGLLVSTISSNQVMAMLICGMVMILPVIMLSGLLFPIDNLPVVLKQLSAIVPARWYISAMRKLMIQGLSLSDVVLEVAILAGTTLLIFTVAMRKFNDRLQ
ncbi:MAG: ABC transporter permease [Bacteroidales bacterium]|nr:ABC transporter permease [Bacteroidales bacterium]